MRRVKLTLIASALLLGVEQSAGAQECVCDFTIEDIAQCYDSIVLCETNPVSCLCSAAIPTVSEWGLIVMALLALTAGTVVFGRRRRRNQVFGCLLLLISIGGTGIWAGPVVFGHPGRHGTTFNHIHPASDYDEDERACVNQEMLAKYEGIEKVSAPTTAFNCAGYAMDGSNSFINDRDAADTLTDDLYDKLPAGTAAQVGDRIVYKDAAGDSQHIGVVTGVDGEGNVTEVTSKWGAAGVYKHPPGTVPPSYGANRNLWR